MRTISVFVLFLTSFFGAIHAADPFDERGSTELQIARADESLKNYSKAFFDYFEADVEFRQMLLRGDSVNQKCILDNIQLCERKLAELPEFTFTHNNDPAKAYLKAWLTIENAFQMKNKPLNRETVPRLKAAAEILYFYQAIDPGSEPARVQESLRDVNSLLKSLARRIAEEDLLPPSLEHAESSLSQAQTIAAGNEYAMALNCFIESDIEFHKLLLLHKTRNSDEIQKGITSCDSQITALPGKMVSTLNPGDIQSVYLDAWLEIQAGVHLKDKKLYKDSLDEFIDAALKLREMSDLTSWQQTVFHSRIEEVNKECLELPRLIATQEMSESSNK